jgi:drug/metabolite transporter (DMT)-like permease
MTMRRAGPGSPAAGVILLGFAQLQRRGLPPARSWALAAASGVLLFGGCHGTLAYAENYVSSGLAAVMLATIPFWIVLIKLALRTEDRPKLVTIQFGSKERVSCEQRVEAISLSAKRNAVKSPTEMR